MTRWLAVAAAVTKKNRCTSRSRFSLSRLVSRVIHSMTDVRHVESGQSGRATYSTSYPRITFRVPDRKLLSRVVVQKEAMEAARNGADSRLEVENCRCLPAATGKAMKWNAESMGIKNDVGTRTLGSWQTHLLLPDCRFGPGNGIFEEHLPRNIPQKQQQQLLSRSGANLLHLALRKPDLRDHSNDFCWQALF